MKDGMEILLSRRSIRTFKNEIVDDETVYKILKAAHFAPSSWNRQPWRFIIIKNKETLKKLAEILPYGKFLSRVPMAIAILSSEKESDLWLVDGSAATENLMLAGTYYGLGTCWIAESDNDEIKKILNVPNDFHIITITPLGYPQIVPKPPERKKLEDLVYNEKFGEKYNFKIEQNEKL